jgi:ParB family chromosome partitioning protein
METIMTKNKTKEAPVSGTVLFIPLNKLKKSPCNARKTPHPKADIEALAASIAAVGMLQTPVVEPEYNDASAFTGHYLVTIGEGRRQAQLLRVKRKEITKSEPIRCLVDCTANTLEISLAENAIRSPMHPADQFEAFYELHTKEGMNAEDIAARFGVSPVVVKQRLKLAAISPILMKAYRDDALNLSQLTAFAFTDDHAKQERVWKHINGDDCDRSEILELLNEQSIAADDPRAAFVGLDAYQAAGGAIARDLFDEEQEGFLTDADLLNSLVEAKLEEVAETVRAEGWKWVEVCPRYDFEAVAEMRRVYPHAAELEPEAEAKIEALEAELEVFETGEGSDEATTEAERLEQEIAALRGDDVFDPDHVARGGAIVAVGRDGEARIERGFIRKEDDIRHGTSGKAPKADATALSEKLVAELTAYRTAALQNALGQDPDTALRAVVHTLACATFYPHSPVKSCLTIKCTSEYLPRYAPEIEECVAKKAMAKRHEAWIKRIPDDAENMWEFVLTLDQRNLLALLAECASHTVNAVTARYSEDAQAGHADQLAHVLALDMRREWKPTAKAYFSRVSKERILDAVREAVSPEAAQNLATLKKAAMADAAEQRIADRGWLPQVLRLPEPVSPAAE